MTRRGFFVRLAAVPLALQAAPTFVETGGGTRSLIAGMSEGSIRIPNSQPIGPYGLWIDGGRIDFAGRALHGEPYLRVTLPCGETRVYEIADVLPLVTVECPCGRLPYRHYFVQYGQPEPTEPSNG